jgi:putative flippase GtrA
LFRQHRRRAFRFALVGGFCFGVQYAIMMALAQVGIDLSLGNAIGFVVSAQLNYGLSAVFTWGDGAGLSWLRWASYNSTALLGLAVNTAVFTVVHQSFGSFLGTAAGVGAGAVFTYLVCNFLIFRQRRTPLASTVEAEISA